MIDWTRIEELKRDFGEDEFLEIADMFLMEVDEKLDEINAGSPDTLVEDFHFLKGSAANLGFVDFQSFCADVERNPDRDKIGEARKLYEASKAEFRTWAETALNV